MIDIDHFKQINDRYGHAFGDECLRLMARSISSVACRPGDLAARYGGDEFAVLLPHTDAGGALSIAKRIQDAVRVQDLRPPSGNDPVRLTVSIGITTRHSRDRGSDADLVEVADRALYEAKHNGRDRIMVAGTGKR